MRTLPKTMPWSRHGLLILNEDIVLALKWSESTIALQVDGLVEVAGLERSWENHLHPGPSSSSCR